MEYIELQELWGKTINTEIEISINQKGIDEMTVHKLKNTLSEIKYSAIIEIVLTSIWYLFLLNFVFEYSQNKPFFISGIVLILISCISIILEIKKLFLYNSINYGFTILKAQTQIEKLKLLEKIDLNLIYLLVPLFSLPFALVFCKGILGIDLIEQGLGQNEMVHFFLGSIVVAIIIVFLLRKSEFKKFNESLEFLKKIKENA